MSAEHEDERETLERYSAEAWMRYLKRDRSVIADPAPATHAMFAQLKAGECIRHSI